MSVRVGPSLRRKGAFLLSGGVGFALYYAVSLALVRIAAIEPEWAAFVGVLVAIVPTFALQKRFAFRHVGDTLPSFAKYCLLQGFNAVLTGALARLGRVAGLSAEANVAVAALVAIVVSYLVLSRVVFPGGGRDAP